MPFVDPYDKEVAIRLLDFFASGSPWQRRLWASGVVLTLKEVLEASQAMRQGVLHTETLGDLTAYASKVAGLDPGLGTPQIKQTLQQVLKKTMVPGGADYSTVDLILRETEANYFTNLRTVATGTNKPKSERLARCIASHLLDSGYSGERLHRWCTHHARNASGAKNLSELLEDAQSLATKPSQTYKIVVAFHRVPPNLSGMPENWLSAEDTSKWLLANGVTTTGVRLRGSMLFHVNDRDVWAALQATVENVEQLRSRVALGAENALRPTGQAWVEGETSTFTFKAEDRRVEVHALHRNNKLYAAGTNSIVDAALELLGSLRSGPASSAAAVGWAAIEAVLRGPGDTGVNAADRMASLVACSFVRAELTQLSYRIEKLGGAMGVRLASCTTNRDRAALVATAILQGTTFSLSVDSDNAAFARMTNVVANSGTALPDIQSYISVALRRLYRIRNLVMHGGKTNAVGLAANLRTAAPLVGAGMDRIAHAWFVENIGPMELSARATLRLATVGLTGAPSPVDLLS